MTQTTEPQVNWSQDQMIEVKLNEPDDFLKVRETLTRIGVASRKEKKLYQSCHILHKQGKYYLACIFFIKCTIPCNNSITISQRFVVKYNFIFIFFQHFFFEFTRALPAIFLGFHHLFDFFVADIRIAFDKN